MKPPYGFERIVEMFEDAKADDGVERFIERQTEMIRRAQRHGADIRKLREFPPGVVKRNRFDVRQKEVKIPRRSKEFKERRRDGCGATSEFEDRMDARPGAHQMDGDIQAMEKRFLVNGMEKMVQQLRPLPGRKMSGGIIGFR